MVAAKLGKRVALKESGILPENVNYAIKSTYLLALLESLDLPPNTLTPPTGKPQTADVVRETARQAAVMVMVYQ